MKKKKIEMRFFTTVLLILLVYVGYSKQKPREMINCASVHEDRVFMSISEVTNISYLEFLSYQKNLGIDISELLPDTLVWRDKIGYSEPYVEYYFRHPAYRQYPVVGVSKVQAELFCDWLTKVLIEKYRSDEGSDIDSLIVRLPTKQEWIFAAQGGNEYYEYPWKGHSLRVEEGKFQGQIRANFVRYKGDYMGIAGSLNDNADITAPVISYWPNDFGLYNCAGNVAEMIADEDKALGGCWRSSGYNIKVTSEIPFSEPSSQVGFRYLIEVVKLKPKKAKSKLDLTNASFKKMFLSMTNDSTYVSKFEVTNELYNLFIKETNHPIQDTTVWNDQFPYSNWFTCNYRWHSNYANYPAVGMTRKDVQEFSVWMGRKMTSLLGKDVMVELPDSGEWERFARGGLDLSPYPWGGPYLRNSKGCLLANFKYVPESFNRSSQAGEEVIIYPSGKHDMYGADFDGAMGTSEVNSYHPNGYQLYCMAGNAREMVKEQGMTKGGGWHSFEYFLQISSIENYDELPAADVGFRFIVRL